MPKKTLSAPLDTKKYAADCAQIGPGWPSLGGMIKDCHNFMQGCPNMTWSRATSEDCVRACLSLCFHLRVPFGLLTPRAA